MTGIVSMMPGQAGTPAQPMVPSQQRGLVPPIVGPMEQQIQARMSKGETVDQILSNPPPLEDLWAFFTALGKASKKQKVDKSVANNQAAMAGAQNAQMPPVIAQVADAARQAELESGIQRMYHGGLVSFNRGGIVQRLNNGGAVKFQTAGVVPSGLLNPDFDEEGLPRSKDERERVIDYNNKIRAAYEQQMRAKAATKPRTAAPSMQEIAETMAGRRQLEQFYKPRESEAYTPEMVGYRVPAGAAAPADAKAANAPFVEPEAQALMTRQGPRSAPKVNKPPAPPSAPAQTAAAPTQAASSGVESLIKQPISEAEAAAREQQEAIRKAGELAPGAVAARERMDALTREIIENTRKEQERLGAHAEKRYGEAKARAAAKPFDDIQYIGAMLSGMKGTKRFGEGLAGAVSGMGSEQARRQDALRRAEETYDLKQGELFKLQTAQLQLAMDQAKLSEARETGDKDRIDKAAIAVADSKRNLANLKFEIEQKVKNNLREDKKIDLERQKVEATREQTSEIAKSRLQGSYSAQYNTLKTKMQEELRKIEKDYLDANPMLRAIGSQKSIGQPVPPEQERAYQDAMRKLQDKLNGIKAEYMPQLTRLEGLIGVPSVDLSKWGAVSTTPSPTR